MELWKPIQGYELSYKISNRGRIMSLVKPQVSMDTILKTFLHNGHPSVCLIGEKAKLNSYYDKKMYRVGKLVAIHFIEGFDGYMNKTLKVRNDDGNMENCAVENLVPRGIYTFGSPFGKITGKNMKDIDRLFWRAKLRKAEKVVDNRTSIIARELGLGSRDVGSYIDYILEQKYKNFKQ